MPKKIITIEIDTDEISNALKSKNDVFESLYRYRSFKTCYSESDELEPNLFSF